MSFDWSTYLQLAKRLATEKGDEASLRSAVSRAYYCVFNLAMIKAKSNDFRTKDDAGSHDQLWTLYGRNTDLQCPKISNIGARMKRRRVKADYHSSVHKLEDEVADALADADECIAIISALPKELPADVPRSWSFH
jgi:uncharacterized protein (UPF0332 family)